MSAKCWDHSQKVSLIFRNCFIFSFLMSEGFGHLVNLQELNMNNCRKIQFLPESESHHSESFYFLIFDVRRLRAAG